MIRFAPSRSGALVVGAALASLLAAPARAQIPAAAPPPVAQTAVAPIAAAPERSWALSAQAGVVLPGSIYIEPYDWDTGTGFNIRAAADFYVSNRLSMGVYVQRISTTLTEVSTDVAMTAFGGTLVGRFGRPERAHVRGGIGLGYQIDTVDRAGFKDAKGFGISPFVELVLPVGAAAWFAHVGFNSQPSGGNADAEVTWGPIFELALGAEFGM